MTNSMQKKTKKKLIFFFRDINDHKNPTIGLAEMILGHN